MNDVSRRNTRLGRGRATALTGAIGLLFAAGAVAPAAAQDGGADATGLSANLQATIAEEEVINLNEQLAATSVNSPGHDEDDVAGIDIDEDDLGLSADVIASESHWTDDATSASAEITQANLRLGDVNMLHADVLTADVVCPTDGATSADAQVAGLTLADQAIDAEADLPADATVPVDLDVDGVVSAEATVTLRQVEDAGADAAHASALIADVEIEAVLSDQEVVTADVGEIVLADANCERPAGVSGDEGDGSQGDDGAPEDDGSGLPDDGDGLPDDEDGLPGGDEDGAPEEGDEDGTPEDDDGAPGGEDGLDDVADDGSPSADDLEPDSGPTEGGTEVTVEGNDLDATETVTIDGEDVEFTVGDDTDTLTFTTPGGDPGTVEVEVTFDDDTADQLEFTYEEVEVLADGMSASDDGDGDAAGVAASGSDDAGALPATGTSALIGAALGLVLLTAGGGLLLARRRATSVS